MPAQLSAAARAKIEKIAARYPTRQAAELKPRNEGRADGGEETDEIEGRRVEGQVR